MRFLRNVKFQLNMYKFSLYHYTNPYKLVFFSKNMVRPQNKYMLLHFNDSLRQRHLPRLLHTDKHNDASAKSLIDWRKHLPEFVKEGSHVMVKNSNDYTILVSGIMYRDIEPAGVGECIDGKKQKVSLYYNYYNQSGEHMKSENFEGSLAELELPDNSGPGLKEGIKGMKPNGRRIIIIPLQEKYGVFGVELHSIRHKRVLFGLR